MNPFGTARVRPQAPITFWERACGSRIGCGDGSNDLPWRSEGTRERTLYLSFGLQFTDSLFSLTQPKILKIS